MNQLRPFIFLTLLLSTSLLSFAQQTGSIRGTITTADGKVAGYVSIGLKELGTGTLSNENGDYRIGRVKPGAYTLKVSAIGLSAQEKPVTVTAGKTAVINFMLAEDQHRLQEVVVNGSKNRYKTGRPSASLRLDEPLHEIPQNIQIVTAATLADQQVISMSDGAIRNVSGATRLEHWGDMYTRINMRGSQIAAFRNGLNVVNSSWGPLTEDMSFVDHIEFVKGPAGFMMANGDPSGMYNVVTKQPSGAGFNGGAAFTFGSYDLYRSTLDLDGGIDKQGKLLYRLNLMAQSKNSFRANEYNNRYSIAPVLRYKIDEQTSLTAEYTLQHAKMSNVGSYYVFSTAGYGILPRNFSSLPQGIDPTTINDHSLYLNLRHQLNSNWKFTAQAAYFNYSQTGSSAWATAVNTNGTMIRNISIWDAESEMKFGQAFLNGNITTGAVQHRILAGLDMGTKNYLADWGQSHDLDTAGAEFNTLKPVYGIPVNGYPDFDRSQSLEVRATKGGGLIDQKYSGLYVQDELGFLNNRLRLTLAGRYTYVKQSSYGGAPEKGKRFTPRLGLSASIDDQTSVYALYDQAFIPQAGVLRNGGSVKPITGNNTELGIKKDWFGGRWNTTLSAYRILKNNELTSDPANTPAEQFSVTLGQKRAQGIEFDLKGEILSGLNLIANYAYTDSKVTEVTAGVSGIHVNDRIPGFAKHNINTWLNYKVQAGALKGAGVSAGFSYQKDRDTWSWGTAGTKGLPDYFRLDGGAFFEKGKLKFTANVFNVLDKYLYSGSYYGYSGYYYWQAEAPRNYRFGTAYKF